MSSMYCGMTSSCVGFHLYDAARPAFSTALGTMPSMIKLTYALRRRSELSREDFQRYWRETHAPLVSERAATLRIRRYVQAHTVSTPLDDALRSSRGASVEPFDGVAELWWDSPDDMA